MKSLLLVLVAVAFAAPAAAEEPPVAVSIAVNPSPAAPGTEAAVTVTLKPKAGIKLNKYPKTKLVIAPAAGIAAAAEGAIGAGGPPASDQLEANYYKGNIDPLVVKLQVDPAAASGRHDLPAKLSYFYCVAASGYCAPAKVDVSVPLIVR